MTVNEKGQLKNKGGWRNMEKKTGRSRKAVQPLKPKKLVYWAVAIPAFLALLLFAIVFLDHSDNDISRAMASKAMALSFADRDDIVASQGEHGSHFGTPDQDEWYAKYIDYMIEEGYLEPGDEKISKSYAMGALTYGEAAYAADRVSKGLSSALNVSKNKYNGQRFCRQFQGYQQHQADIRT